MSGKRRVLGRREVKWRRETDGETLSISPSTRDTVQLCNTASSTNARMHKWLSHRNTTEAVTQVKRIKSFESVLVSRSASFAKCAIKL